MSKKILLIDDEPEIRSLLIDLLDDEGFITCEAGDGDEGLKVFQQEKPDLVITDMRMPVKSGLEVLNWIRSSGSDVDVIILTGQSDEATAIDCLKAGAYDYLLKPIEELDVLLTAINRALQKRHLEQQNKQLLKTLEEMAIRDPLTGVYNVRQFHPSVDDEIARSERYDHEFCLLFLDIDHFKTINDTYGHPLGDYVLKTIVSIMSSVLRSPCKLFRYGGDEFVVIMPETGQKEAVATLDRLICHIREYHFQYDDQKMNITVSIGAAIYPGHSIEKAELIKFADQALYSAKKAGRDCYKFVGE